MALEGNFAQRRVLITGAAGFIGSHLLARLCEAGAEVHAVSRAARAPAEGGLRWWRADLAELERVQSLMREVRPEIIYHLASHVSGSRNLKLVDSTFRSNLMSAVNLLTAAAEIGGCRVVLTGSLEEPDASEPAAAPSSPYAAAKWAVSGYGRMFATLYGLPVVLLRVFMVYGPAQRDLTKLVPYVTLCLLRGETPKLSSGLREVDWVFVDDVVDAFLAAGMAAAVDGNTVDVGSGSLVTIRSVVEQLVQLIDPRISPQFGALPDRPFEQVRRADVSAAASAIGWSPRTSLGQGLKHTVEWYRRAVESGAL